VALRASCSREPVQDPSFLRCCRLSSSGASKRVAANDESEEEESKKPAKSRLKRASTIESGAKRIRSCWWRSVNLMYSSSKIASVLSDSKPELCIPARTTLRMILIERTT